VHVLDVTATALVRLLVIAAILAVPVLLAVAWRSGRRWRLVVAEVVNSTGDSGLNDVTAGLTQLARERIDIEIRVVSRRRDLLIEALSGEVRMPGAHGGARGQGDARTAGRRRSAGGSATAARVQRRMDNDLAQLLSAARDIAPQQAQPAVQLLVMLVSRPRGLMVAGIMQRRGSMAAPRFGVTFDVLHLDGSTSVASKTFWEAEDGPGRHGGAAADDTSPQERMLGLFAVAARWVAIQLMVHTVFPHGARRRKRGMDKVVLGILLRQSADGFQGHETEYRRLAAQALGEAGDELAKSPRPRPHLLAGLADSLDQLAAAEAGSGPSDSYARAHAAYAQAVAAIERMRPPDAALLGRYRIRQAICWLASAQPGPCKRAIDWLSGSEMTAPAPETATDLYDLACLYALASGVPAAVHPEWRHDAARFLVRALAADLPGKSLWAAAPRDPQLRTLHGALPYFTAAINEALAGDGSDRDPAGQAGSGAPDLGIEEIVARGFPVS
jgi:hypothetical protein